MRRVIEVRAELGIRQKNPVFVSPLEVADTRSFRLPFIGTLYINIHTLSTYLHRYSTRVQTIAARCKTRNITIPCSGSQESEERV